MDKTQLKLMCATLCELTKVMCDDDVISSSSSSSSSSDEEDFDLESIILERENVLQTKRDLQLNLDSYSDTDFRTHFRVTRETVEVILSAISPHWVKSRGRPPAPCKTAILLTLWGLANQETYRQLGDRFALSTGHAHRVFTITTELISKYMIKKISWPTKEQAITNSKQFSNCFPNVVGCLDATHIPIAEPLNNNYYNQNGFHSVILQVVSDATSKFIDVYCGWPGSTQDSVVWENSPLYKLLKKKPDILPANYHLLADLSYPLDTFVMVPFRNDDLTPQQRRFNTNLNRVKLCVTHAVGQLKCVFRRLKFVQCQKIENIKDIILSACILHNLRTEEYIENENLLFEEYLFDEEMPDVELDCSETDFPREAIEKRRYIMRNLMK